MGINIALNTIIYVMLFLFPGILFRKFLFIREHSKQFNAGNLFERFLWTVFFSIVIFTIGVLLILLLNKFTSLEILKSISYQTIVSLFNAISKNQLPNVDIVSKTYKDFLYLLTIVYGLACGLGVLAYTMLSFQFVKNLGIFKRTNHWQDILKGGSQYKESDRQVYAYTLADVLTETNNGTKLYSGMISDYYIDSSTNKLQTIILSNAHRYKFPKQESKAKPTIVKILGHDFVIEADRILNINLRYIYERKDKTTSYIKFKKIISVTLVAATIFFMLTVFTTNLYEKYLFNFMRIVAFIIFTPLLASKINQLIPHFLTGQFSKYKAEDASIIFLVLPFLWILNFVSWYWFLGLEIALLFGLAIILSKKQK